MCAHAHQRFLFIFQDQGLTTAWDDHLSYLLTPALAAYENERTMGRWITRCWVGGLSQCSVDESSQCLVGGLSRCWLGESLAHAC